MSVKIGVLNVQMCKNCNCMSLAVKKGSKYIKNTNCKYILYLTKTDN